MGIEIHICHYWYRLRSRKIEKELDECLLNSSEMNSDWYQLEDPYHWKIRKLRNNGY